MKIVVDTNVIVSAILHPSGKIGELLMYSQKDFQFYSPYLVKDEIKRHQIKLLQLSQMESDDFDIIRDLIFNCITFISEEQIPFEYWQNALPIVREVDIDDIAFVVLAEYIDAKLWTGDKKLLSGIFKKGFQRGINTDDVYALKIAKKD
jgi:predicted nucleic acid-binding protein